MEEGKLGAETIRALRPAENAGPDEAAGTDRSRAPKTDLSSGAPAENGSATVPDAQAQSPQAALTPPSGPPPGFTRQHELIDRVKAYDPDADEHLLNRAYVFAMKAHGGQMRSSGDPYFTHPIAVAAILTELRLDPSSIATALLHDVVEDTDVSVEDIEASFGPEVAVLVDGVTKISKRELAADADGKAESFAKFILATAKDARVLLVKLADRLHNMRTLSFISSEEKRKRISRETMDIYVPLAGRIGVQQIKEELEDLSFLYLNPEAHAAIQNGLERMAQGAVHDVVALAQTLRGRLDEARIAAEVHSREKRAFSIWRKMQRKNSIFEELADIYAFRVIVPTPEDCYRALGVIHTAFAMIPGEFDDYISTPKPNNYQSIHTAVLATGRGHEGKSLDGQRVEIQIRSKGMHETAERGIAAHWRYKDAAARQETGRSVEIAQAGRYDAYEWLRGAVGSLQEGGDAKEFLAQAKMDLYRDQVFPFTPRGRVIPLPHGATGIDFAYALHTDIGDTYAGVKINGVPRPNRTPLRSGDVVEILRSDDAPIPHDWERLAVTGNAKTYIRKRIRQLQKKEQLTLGRRIVTSAFAARDLPFSEDAVRAAAKRMGFRGLKPLLEAAGRMEMSGQTVIDEVFPNLDAAPRAKSGEAVPLDRSLSARKVSLAGLQRGAQVRLSRCCAPLPGERIVGVKGEGGQVAVHRIDCASLAEVSDREWIDLSWAKDEGPAFVASIVVTVNNRTGAIGHIGSMLARYDADIVDMELQHREVDFSDLCFDIAVSDAKHLANVLTGLRASDYVVEAERRNFREGRT